MCKNKRMKAALAALLLILCGSLGGCKRLVPDEPQAICVYASFYPIYALTDAVMRDVPDAELHCLVQPQDGCLRAYQLSDWDAALLASGASAVIMGGRGLESFEKTLFDWGEAGPAVSAVLYNLELYTDAMATGGDSPAQAHLKGPNPHLYLSIDGARHIVESISATMQSLDPGYADVYIGHAQAAIDALDSLLTETKALLEPCAGRPVALLNEALVYPALDYGLKVAGQIERESGETMVDDALTACIERLSGMEAQVLLIEKQAPAAFVRAIEAAGFSVARIDVMSTHREGEGFEAYLDIQRANAQAIRAAFDRADGGKD